MRLQVLFFLLLVSCLSSASGFTTSIPNHSDLTNNKDLQEIEKHQNEILQKQNFILNQIDLINLHIEKTEENANGK